MKNNVKIKAQLYKYKCEKCGNKFKFPVYPIGAFSYGEFLLKSKKSDEMMYLNALDDVSFSELSEMVKDILKNSGLSELERSNIFQKVIGVAYDKNSFGDFYGIGFPPVCPVCRDEGSKKHEETEPPEYEVIDVPQATSIYWNSLDFKQRLELVFSELDKNL